MPPRFIARQLARPTGYLGRLMGHLMNRTNAKMNEFAVRQLELTPPDRVLEIGFGGGGSLTSLIEGAAFVCGVDRSREVVEWARTRFADAVASGRADFREGDVESLPFASESFGKAYTVNTVYFWPSLEAGFAEIHRVLGPSGRVVVGFAAKDWMDRHGYPTDIFTSRAPEDVVAALSHAGFRDVRTERPAPTTTWRIVVASRC